MINLSVQNEGAEIHAVDITPWRLPLGIAFLLFFLFMALATIGLIQSAIASPNSGSVIMALVSLAGTALVGFVTLGCFAREELRFDAAGAEACMKFYVKFRVQKIALGDIESITIQFAPWDDDESGGSHKLTIQSRAKAKPIQIGTAAKSEELEEALKVLQFHWETLKRENSPMKH